MFFSIANVFNFVEYYLSRGMKVDDLANNLSFFFSNGLDPEYTVIGSVARKIWAVAMRDRYGASEKSQKFKYQFRPQVDLYMLKKLTSMTSELLYKHS